MYGGGYARVIFIGSSKGGYSALNFSFLIPGVLCIIGSPQYFLGTYLDKENTKENLKFLIGEITDENKEKLNNRLKQRVLTSSIHPQCVYFHYSNKEPTYMKHVRYMLDDLKSARIRVVHDVKYYSSHDELSLYYPPFLIETIKKIINESPSNL